MGEDDWLQGKVAILSATEISRAIADHEVTDEEPMSFRSCHDAVDCVFTMAWTG